MTADSGIVLGTKEEVVQLASLLLSSGDTHFRQGRYSEALQPYRQALEIYAKVGDVAGEAQCKTAMGRVLLKEGEADRALLLLEEALATHEAREDRAGMAATLNEIGSLHRSRGDLAPALDYHRRAYAIREAMGDESGLAALLVNIGSIHRMQGDYDQAQRCCTEAHAIYQRLGERTGIARVLVNLGNVHTERGETSKAVSQLKEAQSIWESLGDREQSAEVLNSIAALYAAGGDHAKAMQFFSRALATFEEIGNLSRTAAVLNNLGVTAKNLGQFPEAIRHLERSIDLKRQLGDCHLISHPLANLAGLNYMLGDFASGLARGEESLAIKQEMKDRKGEINARLNIAHCHGGLEAWEAALTHAAAALEVAEKLGVRENICDGLFAVARCRMRLGAWEEAAAVAGRAAELARKIKDREFEAISESLLGELAWWRGDRVEGDGHFVRAVGTLGRLESKHHLGVAYFDAGRCYGEHDEKAPALTYLQRAREIFSSLGAQGWVVRTDLAIGRYCAAQDPVTTAWCLSEAMELAEALQDATSAATARDMMRALRTTVEGIDPGSYLSMGKLSALYQFGATINQILDLDDLLARLLEQIIRNLGADRGGVYVALPGGAAAAGRSATAGGERHLELARTAAGERIEDAGRLGREIREEVAATGAALLGRDAQSDESLRRYEAVRVDGATSFICVPLAIKGVAVGSVYVDNLRPGHLFAEDDSDFLAAICNMAAPAIENARLYEDLRLANELLDEENVELRREVAQRYQYENFVGSSDAMQGVFAIVAKVSKSRVNVLIRGASGTGKELVAKTIHYNSDRSDGPFVKLNCAALPESLVESELFGVERGTATGVEKRIGKFEQASGGTLFLDEIGDMPLSTQIKVLRVLQEREFERVGGRTTIRIDVRLISATNMDLEQAIAAGSFRSDLYYRLNVVTTTVPALCERRSDIPSLVKHFLESTNRSEGKRISGLSKEAWDLLLAHDWPGNVRELQNCIEQAVVMCDGEKITPAHLPPEIRRAAAAARGRAPVPGSLPAPTGAGPLERTLEVAEEAAIRAALARFGGNKSRAAAELGIARVTLYAKMKKHGMR